MKKLLRDYWGAIAVWAFLLVLMFLCSCTTTKYVEVPTEKIHIEYKTKYQIDSIYSKDSIFVKEYIKGDTVFQTKEVLKWRNQKTNKTDTVIVNDTIPVIVEVDRPETLQLLEDVTKEAKKKQDEARVWFRLFLGAALLLIASNWRYLKKIVSKFIHLI